MYRIIAAIKNLWNNNLFICRSWNDLTFLCGTYVMFYNGMVLIQHCPILRKNYFHGKNEKWVWPHFKAFWYTIINLKNLSNAHTLSRMWNACFYKCLLETFFALYIYSVGCDDVKSSPTPVKHVWMHKTTGRCKVVIYLWRADYSCLYMVKVMKQS